MNNDFYWHANFEALKAHVAKTGHFPNKHTTLNNWCRYQRKRIKVGTITQEQKELFEQLAASRSREHTGGRKRYV
ncbi:MAG: helicase associated domain-containing protein [Bacteroidaceae bacterium]|nr:helicase associated domain-containing protein [Bacteroidaceae bacterium]